jgi:hypothetical protein
VRQRPQCDWSQQRLETHAVNRGGNAHHSELTWSGRRDSNPRRPAWEVIRHSNLKGAQVLVWRVPRGLENQACTASALLMECNWSAAVRNDQQRDLHEASGILIEIRRRRDWCPTEDFRRRRSA